MPGRMSQNRIEKKRGGVGLTEPFDEARGVYRKIPGRWDRGFLLGFFPLGWKVLPQRLGVSFHAFFVDENLGDVLDFLKHLLVTCCPYDVDFHNIHLHTIARLLLALYNGVLHGYKPYEKNQAGYRTNMK